jgi:hypothetical protein
LGVVLARRNNQTQGFPMSSPRYVVARKLNRFGDRDYIIGLCNVGTIAVGTPRLTFASRADAALLMAESQKATPCFLDGRAIQYEVVAL